MAGKRALCLHRDDVLSMNGHHGHYVGLILLRDDLSTWPGCLNQGRREAIELSLHIFSSLLLHFILWSSPPISSILSFSLNLTLHLCSAYNFFSPHCGCHNHQLPPSHTHKCQHPYCINFLTLYSNFFLPCLPLYLRNRCPSLYGPQIICTRISCDNSYKGRHWGPTPY